MPCRSTHWTMATSGISIGYRPVNDLPDDEFQDIVDSLRLDLDTSAIEMMNAATGTSASWRGCC